MRTWNKYGAPMWLPPYTPDEIEEMWEYGLSGHLPYTMLPERADRTNVTPFPLPRRKGPKLT